MFVALCACASALREPTPISQLAPGRGAGRSADELVIAGDAAWARHDAASAQDLYLDAAAADDRRTDAVIGAMKAMSWRLEHPQAQAQAVDGRGLPAAGSAAEGQRGVVDGRGLPAAGSAAEGQRGVVDGRGLPAAGSAAEGQRGVVDKRKLAEDEVSLGQWCQHRAPQNVECDYRLALAIGQQARERKSTGRDAMDRMVALLKKTTAIKPELDDGAPHRVLAIVYLRAPAWPIGPGDPEQAIDEAQLAVKIASTAENQLVLADALAANDRVPEAKEAYAKALALAKQSQDPDAPQWAKQAEAGLR